MGTKNPLQLPSPALDSIPQDLTESEKEQQYVHDVYQIIAPHFSATRYKPWPVVERFLQSFPVGSLGADVGCGNGKYLGVNPNLFMIGSDRSSNLIDICRTRGFEVMIGDGLALTYRDNCFDFAISIAVIHHFTSPERRLNAIKELLRIVRPGGKILVFVWALEQNGRRNFDRSAQDVFVPWVMPKIIAGGESDGNSSSSGSSQKKRSRRTKEKSDSGDSMITESKNEERPEPDSDHKTHQGRILQLDMQTIVSGDGIVSSSSAPSLTSQSSNPRRGETEHDVIYNRYYHLFQEMELENLIFQTETGAVVASGYDKDNWYAIIEKKPSPT